MTEIYITAGRRAEMKGNDRSERGARGSEGRGKVKADTDPGVDMTHGRTRSGQVRYVIDHPHIHRSTPPAHRTPHTAHRLGRWCMHARTHGWLTGMHPDALALAFTPSLSHGSYTTSIPQRTRHTPHTHHARARCATRAASVRCAARRAPPSHQGQSRRQAGALRHARQLRSRDHVRRRAPMPRRRQGRQGEQPQSAVGAGRSGEGPFSWRNRPPVSALRSRSGVRRAAANRPKAQTHRD